MLITALVFAIICAIVLSLMVMGVYSLLEKIFEHLDAHPPTHHHQP
ncbi:hypothetical protein [Deinococcus roseus]|uniref:Uncharacterized protein n=1 Tax=Deinococcus roseus TaxID=392414 RepID=A0ABQ2D0V9_9DEIO|nr:hypothetical protein [Deinococcus roseus]GGJ38454.1 hypothetical protein GCM10008938_25730 [Deinococcus roseus]